MRVPFVGRICVGRVARLDIINRRNRWVAERIVNRDRGRLVKRRRIVVVEHIRIAGGVFWILRDNGRIGWKVQTELNFGRCVR